MERIHVLRKRSKHRLSRMQCLMRFHHCVDWNRHLYSPGATRKTRLNVLRIASQFRKPQVAATDSRLALAPVLEKLASCDLPALWKPKANQFFHIDAIPVLGTGKMDLRGIKALNTTS